MELVLGKGHPLVCPWQIFPRQSSPGCWAAGPACGGLLGWCWVVSWASQVALTQERAVPCGCSSAFQGGESPQTMAHPLEWKSEVPKWMRSWCPSSWGGWRQWWSSWGFLGTWSGLENPKLFGKLLKISILCLPPWSLLWPLLCSAKRMVRA